MVAYTDTYGFYKNSVGFTANSTQRVSVTEIDINFATIAAARSAAGVTALTSTDTLVIATLPKGALILGGAITVVTAEGAACTVDVGITGTLTLFGNDVDINATALTTAGTTTAAYLTADTSCIMTINSANTDTARIKVSIAMINLGANLGTIPSA